MNKLRQFVNSKPWLGWTLAAALLVLSIVLYYRLSGKNDPYSVERMSEMVTIKCVETGDEWTMNRGMMEKTLRERGTVLSPSEGLPNPKTGRLTGFPFNKSEWEATIARINQEKQDVLEKRVRRPAK
jgi:hypothetical protein